VVWLRNEKPAVVDHQRQPSLFLLVGPPNPFLPQLELVSPGTPDHQGHPLALVLGKVTQLFTDDLHVVQIMPFDHDPIKAFTLCRLGDKLHLHLFKQTLLLA